MKKATIVFGKSEPARLQVAESGLERRQGLLPFASPPTWGLMIPRCPSIHTFGMSFAIDVVFLRKGKVVALFSSLPPGRLRAAWASYAVELPSGSIEKMGISKGQSADVFYEAT